MRRRFVRESSVCGRTLSAITQIEVEIRRPNAIRGNETELARSTTSSRSAKTLVSRGCGGTYFFAMLRRSLMTDGTSHDRLRVSARNYKCTDHRKFLAWRARLPPALRKPSTHVMSNSRPHIFQPTSIPPTLDQSLAHPTDLQFPPN